MGGGGQGGWVIFGPGMLFDFNGIIGSHEDFLEF